MTKLEQCKTCTYHARCISTPTCDGCLMHNSKSLNAASHMQGYVNCRCLTVGVNEQCQYYKKLDEGK